jgi:hypothetical protein
MTKPIIKIHNVATGETVEREMNAAEVKQYEADQLAAQTRAEAEATKATEKAALLTRLGISDDEAKLLLS